MSTATIEETVAGLYRALGDRPAFDAHLDPQLTMWESDEPRLMRGLAPLDALRDRRAAAASAPPVSVAPEDLLVSQWGETGLARYVLRARYGDGRPDDCFRVTDVLRRGADGWRIVHHHSEALR
ncbi:MAG TPA: nuclear transport factor 2 family protein [Micromonosporaceae bacterium]|nr:nuclear transport factor 2 family protein [Micromonosporaceae bacterium]